MILPILGEGECYKLKNCITFLLMFISLTITAFMVGERCVWGKGLELIDFLSIRRRVLLPMSKNKMWLAGSLFRHLPVPWIERKKKKKNWGWVKPSEEPNQDALVRISIPGLFKRPQKLMSAGNMVWCRFHGCAALLVSHLFSYRKDSAWERVGTLSFSHRGSLSPFQSSNRGYFIQPLDILSHPSWRTRSATLQGPRLKGKAKCRIQNRMEPV